MKKFAVAGMSFFDNDLKLEIIEAETWKKALCKHSVFNYENDDLSWLSDDIEMAKNDAIDGDFTFDVIEITKQ